MINKISLCYLITVSTQHLLAAVMLLRTLRPLTDKRIICVGNLKNPKQIYLLNYYGAEYINENSIDLTDRFFDNDWKEKPREIGWFKQQFIRLSIDRFIDEDFAVILDSEVFVFNNWDEHNLFTIDGRHKIFHWISSFRKPNWDYMMYNGSAYLLQDLPECSGIMKYSNSDNYKRHITGVAVFSKRNIYYLWSYLEKYNIKNRLKELFQKTDLLFSEYEFYGMAALFGIFNKFNKLDKLDKPEICNYFTGWYDVHNDINFIKFKKNAMWSMCQGYSDFKTFFDYWAYMVKTADLLNKKLPELKYWNIESEVLIDPIYETYKGIDYFRKYQIQLNLTHRQRYATMFKALQHLEKIKNPVIVETGTMHDTNPGGGHSTYKFAEFCSKFNGELYSVDINKQATNFAKIACYQFSNNITLKTMDSIKFLKNFDKKIDLLYLDSYDSIAGQEEKSALFQLEEIKTAINKLSNKSIVLLDDAGVNEQGKTKYSTQFLLKNNFKLIRDGYQRLFISSQ